MQDWQLVFDGLPGALLRVWGTSSKDVYLVGSNGDGKGNLAFHYDGTKWKKLDNGQMEDLWWVQGVAADDVRMVGANGLVLNYTPSTDKFSVRHAPDPAVLFGAWGSSPSDTWYVGGTPTAAHGVIFRDDGTTIKLPMPDTSTKSATVFKVYGLSASDIWMVGQRGLAFHWNGTSFDHPPPSSCTGLSLFTAHGQTSDRVYAVGGAAGGAICAWDGTKWCPEGPDGLPQMNGVWTVKDATAYTAGFNGRIYRRDPSVAPCDKTAWTEVQTNPKGMNLKVTFKDFHSVWVDETGGVWAVGGELSSTPPKNGVLVHYGAPLPTTVQ
jgi:hypothetical protein